MAALINSLDNLTPTQLGKNGHLEYGWSNSIQEKILQFSFQLNRTDEDGLDKLSVILTDLLTSLKFRLDNGSLLEKQVAKGKLSLL